MGLIVGEAQKDGFGAGSLCGEIKVLTICFLLFCVSVCVLGCVCVFVCVLGIDRLKGEFHHSASKAADVNEVPYLSIQNTTLSFHTPFAWPFPYPVLSAPLLAYPAFPYPPRGLDQSSQVAAFGLSCAVWCRCLAARTAVSVWTGCCPAPPISPPPSWPICSATQYR